jgi:uncharacterized protein YndB with AHSA1/START domain
MTERIESEAIAPVRRSVVVNRPADHAFRVFTEEIATWWPIKEHSIAGDRAEVAVLECRVNGRVYERNADGGEGEWGRVLEWEPPSRLALAWQPNPNRAAPTEVEVRFTPRDDGSTLVELEHRGWERPGAGDESVRTEYAAGWQGVLERFASVASAA